MRTYWYCAVSVKGLEAEYSYISDCGEITAGTYVEVPFGPDDDLRIGIVRSCGEYPEEEVPWPVERTKHVMRVASRSEYEEEPVMRSFPRAEAAEVPERELEAVGKALRNEDWEAAFEWASRRRGSSAPAVMSRVVECFEACMEHGIPAAAVELGSLYYSGHYVKKDPARALELYKFGADAGDCRGMCSCGCWYYYGRHAETDYAEAFRYFSLGALLWDDADCLCRLGDMFLRGHGVEQNERHAFRLYLRSLGRCHENDSEGSCIADVQLRVGECLLRGTGTEKDAGEAHALLTFSLLNYYKRLRSGEAVAGSIAKAKKLIAEAQEQIDGECEGNPRLGAAEEQMQ